LKDALIGVPIETKLLVGELRCKVAQKAKYILCTNLLRTRHGDIFMNCILTLMSNYGVLNYDDKTNRILEYITKQSSAVKYMRLFGNWKHKRFCRDLATIIHFYTGSYMSGVDRSIKPSLCCLEIINQLSLKGIAPKTETGDSEPIDDVYKPNINDLDPEWRVGILSEICEAKLRPTSKEQGLLKTRLKRALKADEKIVNLHMYLQGENDDYSPNDIPTLEKIKRVELREGDLEFPVLKSDLVSKWKLYKDLLVRGSKSYKDVLQIRHKRIYDGHLHNMLKKVEKGRGAVSCDKTRDMFKKEVKLFATHDQYRIYESTKGKIQSKLSSEKTLRLKSLFTKPAQGGLKLYNRFGILSVDDNDELCLTKEEIDATSEVIAREVVGTKFQKVYHKKHRKDSNGLPSKIKYMLDKFMNNEILNYYDVKNQGLRTEYKIEETIQKVSRINKVKIEKFGKKAKTGGSEEKGKEEVADDEVPLKDFDSSLLKLTKEEIMAFKGRKFAHGKYWLTAKGFWDPNDLKLYNQHKRGLLKRSNLSEKFNYIYCNRSDKCVDLTIKEFADYIGSLTNKPTSAETSQPVISYKRKSTRPCYDPYRFYPKRCKKS
jgi:hypothetical protein